MNASYKISQITKLTESTILDCYYIVSKSWPNDADGFYYALQNKVNKSGLVMFVASDKVGVVRGFIAGQMSSDHDNAKIDWLFVESHHGRRGLGGILVRAWTDYCRANGIKQVYVQPARTVQARQFYAKYGFLQRDYVLWTKNLSR